MRSLHMLVGAVMTVNISAGCCSAALEAEAELWAWSRTAPPTMTLMAPYSPPPLGRKTVNNIVP